MILNFVFKINKKNYKKFFAENILINYSRSLVFSKYLFVVYLILTLLDLFVMDLNINILCFHLALTIFNLLMLIIGTYINPKYHRAYTLVYVFFIVYWSATYSLFTHNTFNQIIPYLISGFVVASAVYFAMSESLIIYLGSYLYFMILLPYFIKDPIVMFSYKINVTVFLVASWMLSRMALKTRYDQFLIKNEIEEQVKTRTQQLLEKERMAYMGIKTAEIIHNFKNPIMVIKGYVELLFSENPNNQFTKKIIDAVEKLEKMIKNYLDKSKNSTTGATATKQEVDINDLIISELEFVKAISFKQDVVVVEQELDPKLPLIKLNISQISQSLGNIIKNACEAMQNSKEKILRIKTAYCDGMIFISISDTGTGISKDHIKKIFDPFFTTKNFLKDKEQSLGTGLGLSSTKSFIQAHGGTMTVESRINEGTTFNIILPINVT